MALDFSLKDVIQIVVAPLVGLLIGYVYRIDKGLKEHEKEELKSISRLDNDITELKSSIFEKIHREFVSKEQFKAMEERIEKKFDHIETRIDQISAKNDKIIDLLVNISNNK